MWSFPASGRRRILNNEHLYEYAQMWQTIADTAQDICFANAYFAVLSGLVAQRSKKSITTATWMARQSRRFQTKAMEMLRSRTQSISAMRSPYTFRAILYLFISETVFEDVIQARTHLRMLQNLVNEMLGGVNALSPWIRENLLSADVFFAIKSETRPLLPSREWSPGPLNDTWRSRIKTAEVFLTAFIRNSWSEEWYQETTRFGIEVDRIWANARPPFEIPCD